MALTEEQKERLAQARAKEAERADAEAEAAELRELDVHDVTTKLEGQGLKKGVDFDVVNNRLGGVWAIRKPDTRGIRTWEQASEKQKLSLEWQISLLGHYIVEPDDKMPKEEQAKRGVAWKQAAAKWPGLCWQTADRFVDLMSVDRDGAAKK